MSRKRLKQFPQFDDLAPSRNQWQRTDLPLLVIAKALAVDGFEWLASGIARDKLRQFLPEFVARKVIAATGL